MTPHAVRHLAAALVLSLAPGAQPCAPGETPVHHVLDVRIEPAERHLSARDHITGAPLDAGAATLRLHAALSLRSLDEALAVSELDEVATAPTTGSGETGRTPAVRTWRVARKDGAPLDATYPLELEFSGSVHSEIQSIGGEYSKSFASTPGIIDEQGVVLGGASWWVPNFGDELVTFELTIDLPSGWDAVSQGERTRHEEVEDGGQARRRVTWTCIDPMEEVYVIAARFHEYATVSGTVTAYAFLREDDPALASKYLEVTAQYIEMFRQLIGPYPFSKFALVENFWETGYGMPSFTLLGPSVIRLPFILHSSYPHEILHNWWGNGVYVDYESGNWCEGLTAYLADHLVKEGRGIGHEYRRDTLDAYRSYVGAGKDFALAEFRSRHSAATQAVGYGKSLMTWHMLRQRIGDEAFVGGLQRFYRRFRFQKASFDDLRKVFSESAGEDLTGFFAQWVGRSGAPMLEMSVQMDASGTQIELKQVQEDDVYELRVPVAVTRAGASQAELHVLDMRSRTARLVLDEAGIERVDVDPTFDLFRRLHREEIPPTFAGVFGAERALLILPTLDEDPLAAAWQDLAQEWQAGQDQVEILTSDALEALPDDRALWVFGRDNRWSASLADALAARGVSAPPGGDTCFAYALRHPADADLGVGWVGGGNRAALPGLGRKLPHYGKYSFLEFEGDEPTNSAKGQWATSASPLVWTAGATAITRGSLPEAMPLAELAPTFDPLVLRGHVEVLSSPDMQGRGIGTVGIERAEHYIVEAFASAGLDPGGDAGTFVQEWTEAGGPEGSEVRLANVIGILPGTTADLDGESVVIAAHYDHLGLGWPDVRSGNEGALHAGADDNASGVAVLIELARDLARAHAPKRKIVFVAFTGEEWGLAGSRHYVDALEQQSAERVFAMVNMDSVGRLEGKPITVFGCATASEWVHIARGIGFVTGIQSTCVADDPGGSDQVSFHARHIPAVQIFSGAHGDYHRPSDTAERVDSAGLVTVAVFVKEMLLYLSDRPDALSASFGEPRAESEAPASPSSTRRASLGTVPDFEFQGPGVRVSSVVPASAAAEAGVATGDVLLAIDGTAIDDLRGYSQILKSHSPGDTVRIRLQRNGEQIDLTATLRTR